MVFNECLSCSKSLSCFTPDGPGSFPVRSSSIRCEGFDLRADARALYPSSVILQSESLYIKDLVKYCII